MKTLADDKEYKIPTILIAEDHNTLRNKGFYECR